MAGNKVNISVSPEIVTIYTDGSTAESSEAFCDACHYFANIHAYLFDLKEFIKEIPERVHQRDSINKLCGFEPENPDLSNIVQDFHAVAHNITLALISEWSPKTEKQFEEIRKSELARWAPNIVPEAYDEIFAAIKACLASASAD